LCGDGVTGARAPIDSVAAGVGSVGVGGTHVAG
jgi:hypothetical protein